MRECRSYQAGSHQARSLESTERIHAARSPCPEPSLRVARQGDVPEHQVGLLRGRSEEAWALP